MYAAHADGAIEPLQVHVDEDVRRAARSPFAPVAATPLLSLSARLPCAPADARTRRPGAPQPEEYFFCCTWAFNDANGAALLLCAGHKGIIRILDASAQSLYKARCVARTPPRCARRMRPSPGHTRVRSRHPALRGAWRSAASRTHWQTDPRTQTAPAPPPKPTSRSPSPATAARSTT